MKSSLYKKLLTRISQILTNTNLNYNFRSTILETHYKQVLIHDSISKAIYVLTPLTWPRTPRDS